MSTQQLATVTHPLMEAALGGGEAGLFRLPNAESALEKIAEIKEKFVTSKHQTDSDRAVFLWVKGYGLDKKAIQQGLAGNYALIQAVNHPSGYYTLTAEKVDVELERHPERQLKKHKYPKWSHPTLVQVERKHLYPNLKAAQRALEILHYEFPEGTVPGENKLFLTIWSKNARKEKKYLLTIQPAACGGCQILATEKVKTVE